ncbi:uncharacterized protein TNCV_119271 [Trichonephila clavipes]|nr:uncharacterized protein TNCV_119271 [Trichonephila clavipes]
MRKVYGPFVFGEPTRSTYLDALHLCLFPQLKESEPDNFFWQQDDAPPEWHLSVSDWLNIPVIDQWIFRKEPDDKACFTWPTRSPDLTPYEFLFSVQCFNDRIRVWRLRGDHSLLACIRYQHMSPELGIVMV